MATPMRSPSSAPKSSILQRLDELEALMERMLAVPVDEPEEETPSEETAAEPAHRDEPPLVTPHVAFEERPVDVGQVSNLPEPSQPDVCLPEPPQAANLPHAEEPAVRARFHPFTWLNDRFDLGTVWLGPLGRWLQGEHGRGLLGALGVLLAAGAVAWGVLDWLSAPPAAAPREEIKASLDPERPGR